MEIKLTPDNYENIENFAQLLKKEPSEMINEALQSYFEYQHKKLVEKNLEDDNSMTNLDFDEFWDGVDL
jgi:hypothetical protein